MSEAAMRDAIRDLCEALDDRERVPEGWRVEWETCAWGTSCDDPVNHRLPRLVPLDGPGSVVGVDRRPHVEEVPDD